MCDWTSPDEGDDCGDNVDYESVDADCRVRLADQPYGWMAANWDAEPTKHHHHHYHTLGLAPQQRGKGEEPPCE